MLTSKQSLVQIKGIRDGLLIALGDEVWSELVSSLLKQIERDKEFFKGARVALDVGNHILHAAELGALLSSFSEFGISLWAVLSNSPTTERTAQDFGLATRLSSVKTERSLREKDTHMPGEPAILVQRTLRSGYRVEYQGHVVVIGDVNPGAEIVASGSVVVWGKLRGVVHAGAEGDENAVVCALEMIPTQLRISGMVSVSARRQGKPLPEIARIESGQVIVEPWVYR